MGGVEAGGAEEKPGARDSGGESRGRRYRMGRGGARLCSGGIHVGGVTVIRQGGQLQE